MKKMEMKKLQRISNMQKQGGFVGVVFMVIALIAVAMVAFAYMSRSNTSGVSSQSAKANASTILKQAADFRTGYDRLMISGTATASTITFDTTTNTGLFDPAQGYATLVSAPAAALTAQTPYTYTKLDTLLGVGTVAADNVLTLGNVTIGVCQQINASLWGDAATATPPAVTATLAQLTSAPAAVADGTGGKSGRNEGCVGTTDSAYVYYKAMAEL